MSTLARPLVVMLPILSDFDLVSLVNATRFFLDCRWRVKLGRIIVTDDLGKICPGRGRGRGRRLLVEVDDKNGRIFSDGRKLGLGFMGFIAILARK